MRKILLRVISRADKQKTIGVSVPYVDDTPSGPVLPTYLHVPIIIKPLLNV